MIALLQRVKRSSVTVEGKVVGEIGKGLNILLGVVREDTAEDAAKLVRKIAGLRIFEDAQGKMGLSVTEAEGEILVVSQFTLAGSVKKGRRPDFSNAEHPDRAKNLYELFAAKCAEHVPVQTGIFGAMMAVEIVNDGPVTFILDSRELA